MTVVNRIVNAAKETGGNLAAILARLPAAFGAGGGVKVDGSGTALPISAASLPLPTGAATAAAQTTGNDSLADIASDTLSINTHANSLDMKTPSLGQALAASSVPVVLTAIQIAQLAQTGQLPAALGAAVVAASVPVVNAVASTIQGLTLPVAGLQIKATPGTCFSCTWTNSTGGAVFIHFYDGNAQPSAGARPLWYSGSIASANVGSGGMGHITKGVPCPTVGILAILSSTQGTYTAVASTDFKYVFFFE